jgi:hypothetical protein
MEYNRSERINPTPVKELESFLQTWLYFGLLFEIVVGFNASITDGDASVATASDFLNALYDEMVYEEDERKFVRLSLETFDSFLQKALPRIPKDAAKKKHFFDHTILCLTYAHPMITASVPKEFNHAVRYSISALSELLTYTMAFFAQRLEIPMTFGRSWSTGFINEEMKASMRDHGWCPSDIARAESKYTSIQTLHIARMLDKSLPRKDHSRCTDSACKLYQIDMHEGNYKVGHQHEGCTCNQLEGTSKREP